MGFPGGARGNDPPANAGNLRDVGSIPESRRSPGGEYGNPLQYSRLENPLDRGAWQATVYRVKKSQTQLKQLSTHACARNFAEHEDLTSEPEHCPHFLAVNRPRTNNFEIVRSCLCYVVCELSHVWLFATPETVALQPPPSMEFSRQEYWNGLPFPIPEDLPNPGIKPMSLESLALASIFFATAPPGKSKAASEHPMTPALISFPGPP